MAFGKITVVSQAKRPEKKTPAPAAPRKPVVYEKGTSIMEILLIAPTCEEATDFLCSAYFDFTGAVGGSQLAVFTREFNTINRLSETKQDLEEIILKPVGREFTRKLPVDGIPLDSCTITMSQSGNTSLALDLHFTWAAPQNAAGHQADVVFALLNYAQPESSMACMNAARNAAAGRPLFWVITNFEQEHLFWNSVTDSVPGPQLRRKLRDTMKIELGNGEYVTYCQTYGGLEFVRRDGGNAVLRTNYNCREYMPVGCHVPLFLSVDALRRYRGTQEENPVPDATVERVLLLMKEHENSMKGWFKAYYEKGAGGK